MLSLVVVVVLPLLPPSVVEDVLGGEGLSLLVVSVFVLVSDVFVSLVVFVGGLLALVSLDFAANARLLLSIALIIIKLTVENSTSESISVSLTFLPAHLLGTMK